MSLLIVYMVSLMFPVLSLLFVLGEPSLLKSVECILLSLYNVVETSKSPLEVGIACIYCLTKSDTGLASF
jgi:hypothetical protein